MGTVTCGTHGTKCCWRCDDCPKCSGEFKRVCKGDYCPKCVKWLKANGYAYSSYHNNYIPKERIGKPPKPVSEWTWLCYDGGEPTIKTTEEIFGSQKKKEDYKGGV